MSRNFEEILERLEGRDADELRDLLVWLARRNSDACRQIRLRTLDDADKPDVDLEEFRGRAKSIFETVRGAFGKPSSRGDFAHEQDFRSLVDVVRDYDECGFHSAACDMAEILLNVLDNNQNMLNPHRGWTTDVKRKLREIIQQSNQETADLS